MHWGGFTAIGGVAAAVTTVVVTGEDVRRYPVPVSVARERLATAPLPEPLAGIAGDKIIMIREEGALVWHLGASDSRSEGRVILEGKGASTDVTVRFDLADNALGGSPLGATIMTKSMAETLFREHVDSVLGGRPFDMQKMGMEMAQEMQANPQMLEEYGEAVGDHLNGVAAMLNDTMAVENVPAQPRGSDSTKANPDSFKPMTEL